MLKIIDPSQIVICELQNPRTNYCSGGTNLPFYSFYRKIVASPNVEYAVH